MYIYVCVYVIFENVRRTWLEQRQNGRRLKRGQRWRIRQMFKRGKCQLKQFERDEG